MATKGSTDERLVATGEQALVFLRRLSEVIDHFLYQNPEQILAGMQEVIGGGDWLGEILAKEKKYHLNFFNTGFNLDQFRKSLLRYGENKIREWVNLGLEPHFLPQVLMEQDLELETWGMRPEEWFYNQCQQGNLLRLDTKGKLRKDTNSYELGGITVLIDTRCKPAYDDGKQMWKDDSFIGTIIESLRDSENIAKYEYGSQDSRFGISADEWQKKIRPILAKKLGLDEIQVRLERTIEANVIPQLYKDMPRSQDGQTNTWVWHEEFFKSRDCRLVRW